MDIDLILNCPLEGYDAMSLLKTGASLPPEATGQLTEWVDAIYRSFNKDEVLYAPREPMTALRGATTSLTALAEDSFAFVQEDYETFEHREYVAPAALFLGMDLVIRQRDPLVAKAASAREVAKKNGWTTVEDVTVSLLDMEARLVRHGEVVLRLQPALLAAYVADDDDRSYDDTQQDIRRRLDFIGSADFKAHFEASRRSAKLVAEAETLTREAHIFRQSRETTREASVRVTLYRNVLYTAWSIVLTMLQTTFRGALEDDPHQ